MQMEELRRKKIRPANIGGGRERWKPLNLAAARISKLVHNSVHDASNFLKALISSQSWPALSPHPPRFRCCLSLSISPKQSLGGLPRPHSKVLHILGRRPLWRSGLWDACLQCQSQITRGPAARLSSTWTQDADEISRETQKPRVSGRVHVLGFGNTAAFVAHALASRHSPPPITLLLHKPSYYETFRRKKYSLSVNYNGLDDIRAGFDVQVSSNGHWYSAPSSKEQEIKSQEDPSVDMTEDGSQDPADIEPIECLILCCRPHLSDKAISSVKHRLTPDSTILLMQSGLGVVEKLNQRVFKRPDQRPRYIQGVLSHGILRRDHFQVSLTNIGTITLCPTATSQTPLIDAENDTHWAPSTKYLLRLFTLTPSLVATVDTPAGLLQYQLEKLAVSCLIEPLTALSDCKNGELLYVYSGTRVMRLLLFEISSVICALPELKGVPGVEDRFSPERLRRLTLNVLTKTADNTSSLRQDLRIAKGTDIEYLNGWIVARGEQLGIKCVMNYMIKHLVNTKHLVHLRRDQSAIPMDLDLDERGMSGADQHRQ